jgi:hypothetical protein
MLYRLFAALPLFLACTPAYGQTGSPKSAAQMNAEINANLPDQTIGAITPAIMRQTLLDMVASYNGFVSMSNNPIIGPMPTITNATGAEGGLFETVPGLVMEITTGTSANPITTVGPSLHVARTENLTIPTCFSTFNNNECNSAIYGFSQNIGGVSAQMQLTGVMGGALTFAAVDSAEAVGVQGIARAVGTSIAGVAGGYFEGRYDSQAMRNYFFTVGVEGRTNNQTGVDAAFDTTGGNSFNAFVASSSAMSSTMCAVGGMSVPCAAKTNAGLAIGGGTGTTTTAFRVGVVLATNCCERGIWMSIPNGNQAYFGSTGGNNSVVEVDNLAGGNQSRVDFMDAGLTKWQLGKDTANEFIVYDAVGNIPFIKAVTGGNLFLGPAQSVQLAANGATFLSQTTVGALPTCNATTSRGAAFIVTDAAGSPAYNTLLTGGGVSVPWIIAVCDGVTTNGWRAH